MEETKFMKHFQVWLVSYAQGAQMFFANQIAAF